MYHTTKKGVKVAPVKHLNITIKWASCLKSLICIITNFGKGAWRKRGKVLQHLGRVYILTI